MPGSYSGWMQMSDPTTKEEEALLGERPLWHYLRRFKWMIFASAVTIAFTVAINLALPVIIRLAVDELTEGSASVPRLLRYMGLFMAGSVLAVFFSFWTRWLPNRISYMFEYMVRCDMFEHLTRMDQEFYRTERTGDLMTRMTSDLVTLRHSVSMGVLQGMRSGMVFVGAFTVMFITSWHLAILMTALVPLVGIMFYYLIKRVRRAHEQVQEQYSEVSNFSQESFAGIRNIKGAALEGRWIDFFRGFNRDLLKRYMRLNFVQQPLWPLAAFAFSMGMIGILIVGGRRVVKGDLSIGALVQFMQYLLYMQWPILALSWTSSLLQRGAASWSRINRVFDRQPDVRDGEGVNYELKRVAGDICYRNISLRSGEIELLSNINLRIPRGATVGITGPTGSGKSLLVSLLVRLCDPSSGELTIGGHEVREYPLNVLRSHIGFAAQEPVLFSRALSENIAFGLAEVRQEAVDRAARIAHLDLDVDSFPDSYETVLGERGVTLSGGQRQRTSLSRAIAREPSILVLDDVLSAVDTQTEAGIMRELVPVMRARTSILVSHRISTLAYADFIIVLEDGRITQRGTHDELVAEEGYYSELNSIQRIEEELESDE